MGNIATFLKESLLRAALVVLSLSFSSPLCWTAIGTADKPPAPNGVQSLAVYESRIGEPGLLIEAANLQMWVPQSYEEHSQIIFNYLESGYEVLRELYGDHDMPVKFSIKHYPEGSPYFWGGTDGQGTIRYGYSVLVDDTPEWNQYGVPHVIGYYEEMAHCFVRDLGIRGEVSVGYYETLGLMIGQETTLRAAWNPYIQQQVDDGYQAFATSASYYLEHDTCEPHIPENICLTRVLAHAFKTQVVDVHGWEGLADGFAAIQGDYPLRAYARDHTWGGFLGYLGRAIDVDLHAVFGGYGLPVAQWTGEPGYETDGVEHTGTEGQYRFRVRIVDREGNQPTDVQLHLYEDGKTSGMSVAMSSVGGNAQEGWLYEAEVDILLLGRYTYAFSGNDGVHSVFQAIGEPTMKQAVLEHRCFLPLIATGELNSAQ